MSDSSIMSVRDMIDTCFGEPDANTVNFKLMQTILYLLARQLRLLERQVAIKFASNLAPRRSSLSITEVKLKAKVDRKKKTSTKSELISSKAKEEKSKSEKTISKSTTDETSTLKSSTEPLTSDKTFSKSSTDKSSKSEKTSSKYTTDETLTLKSTTEETTTDKSKNLKDTQEIMKSKDTDETSQSVSATDKSTKPKDTVKTTAAITKTVLAETTKSLTVDETSKKPTTDGLKSPIKKSLRDSLDETSSEIAITEKTVQSSKSTSDKTTLEKKSLKSPTNTTRTSELSSFSKPSISTENKSRAGKTRKTRADSREVAEKTPTPMASLDSMEVQYEKLLVVERVPIEEAEKKIGSLRDGKAKLDIVTQKEFDALAEIVREIQRKYGVSEDGRLMHGLRQASSVTDSMAALQLSARIQNLEKSLKLMENMVSSLAKTKGIKMVQPEEKITQAHLVQEAQAELKNDNSETELLFDAAREPSTVGKSTREIKEHVSQPQFTETGKPMLDALPITNINEAELDGAMQTLYDDLITYVGNLTNIAVNKADNAMKCSLGLEAKLDAALDVESHMDELEILVSEYTGKVNNLDANLSSQMSNYQEQLTQMQHDLEAGLEAMAEALANPPGETPGVAELNENFTNLQIQFDVAELRQKDLQEKQVALSLDVQRLWKDIEVLREMKSDRDEVADALRNKAGLGALNGLVTQQQFDAVRGDFEKRIGASYNKFNNQEIVWQKIIDELFREINEKADWVQVVALRDDINKNLNYIQNKICAMEEIVGEPRAATISRKLFRDAACLSCSSPANMNLEESTLPALPAFTKQSTRPPTIGAEDTTKPKEDGDHGLCYPGQPIPHARDPRSYFCRRYCGGSHTTGRNTLTRGPKEVTVSPLPRGITGVGSDGKVYAIDGEEREKKPCRPCNIPKTTTPPGSEIQGTRFELDSETQRYYVLPAITLPGRAEDSAVSVTPPAQLLNDD
ncbi:uncharacterized protein LOC112044539 [Bicyclus anynana]|uniref:Uncharacterized protein LOC112044539 n=1 Tax=Bicyclus anynana TaxID=110368 RepID=A0ABM3LHR6_BICAN|nr:uncharacterized protein LOC112044539 [Bicyclus anynana]